MTGVQAWTRPDQRWARRRCRRPGGRAQHPVGVGVGEDAVGVQPRADRLEVLPARVARGERRRRLEVALAPVRPAAVGVGDRLDGAEVGLPRHPAEDVDRDERRCRGRPSGSSSASSPAVKRSSSGKRRRSARPAAFIARSASAAAARGRAYSISVKRTSRGLAKIRSERSTRTPVPATRAASAVERAGSRAAPLRPSRQSASNARLPSSTSST